MFEGTGKLLSCRSGRFAARSSHSVEGPLRASRSRRVSWNQVPLLAIGLDARGPSTPPPFASERRAALRMTLLPFTFFSAARRADRALHPTAVCQAVSSCPQPRRSESLAGRLQTRPLEQLQLRRRPRHPRRAEVTPLRAHIKHPHWNPSNPAAAPASPAARSLYFQPAAARSTAKTV